MISKFQNFLYTKIIIRNGLNGWAGGWVRLLREQGDLIWLISIMFPIPRFADIRKNNKSVTFDCIFCVKLGWQWARWPKRRGERDEGGERRDQSTAKRYTRAWRERRRRWKRKRGAAIWGWLVLVLCELWVVSCALCCSRVHAWRVQSVLRKRVRAEKIALYAIYVQISWMIFKGKLGGGGVPSSTGGQSIENAIIIVR